MPTARPVLLAAAVLLALAAGVPAGAQPVRVADEVVEKIASPTPYPRTADAQQPAWSRVIAWDGASFIAVHFEVFDLAPGDTLVVRDPAGQVRHVYRDRGPLGRGGNTWALSVAGDTAIVELFASGAGADGTHRGVVIDRWTHGYPERAPFSPEAICGTNDTRDHECYRTSHPTEFARARAVVRLLKDGWAHCTGWLASCENHIVTNEHCVGDQAELDQIEFQFEYRRPACGTGTAAAELQLQGGTLLSGDAPLDYALIMPNLAGNDPQATYGFLQWDVRTAVPNELIYIAGHPDGRPKELALASTHAQDQSGRCEVWSTTEPGCQAGGPDDVGYYCDTEGGSSGSPVLAVSSHRVIALHHCANCPNRGVPIDQVYAHIQASGHPLPACSICNPSAPPTQLGATTPAANQVRLTWTAAPGATRYFVYRSHAGCGGGFRQVGSTAATTFLDTTVSGGVTYSYHVRAINAACEQESAPSNCAQATPTGGCVQPPEFDGLVSATDGFASTCAVDLAWAAATPFCGAGVRYNVYRGTTAGFVPGPGNRVGTCVNGTSWRDTNGLANGASYFYVVRAEDGTATGGGPCNGGHEETNTVERSASPHGPDDVYFAAPFESAAGWTLSGEWQVGAPQGKGGTLGGGSGSPDPSSAWAGAGVLGNDLAGTGTYPGNYEDNLATAQYATGPVFSAAGKTAARLRYRRWLGVETSQWDKATLDVHDGLSWRNVYTNPNSSFSDSTWIAVEHDLTSMIAGRSEVQLRFGIQTDASVRYCGWNVDALEVYQPGVCTTGSGAAHPPVPDGKWAPGAAMTARRAAAVGSVVVTWDVTRCTSPGYHLFHGPSSALATYAYAGAVCNLGSSGSATVAIPDPAPGTFTWWTIAGADGAAEGHHGYTSQGTVRPASGVGRCGVNTHDDAGTCS